jgi:hypothetical protein
MTKNEAVENMFSTLADYFNLPQCYVEDEVCTLFNTNLFDPSKAFSNCPPEYIKELDEELNQLVQLEEMKDSVRKVYRHSLQKLK